MKPDTTDLRALFRRDPRLGAAARGLSPFPGFPPRSGALRTHYDTLARAIVFQQLATKAAETIHARVCALTPGRRCPSALEIARLSDLELRGAGLSAGKLAALRDLAARVRDGRLPLARIARLSDAAVCERLIEVRGIGPWTAQMFLLFRLGRLDVFAPADLGLQEGLRILDGLRERPAPSAALERAEVWRPLRSVASWYLWRIVEREREKLRKKPLPTRAT